MYIFISEMDVYIEQLKSETMCVLHVKITQKADPQRRVYTCARSGVKKSVSLGKRKAKGSGPIKIGVNCPFYIVSI